MSRKRIQQIERRIDGIKKELQKIGPMRPGSLTRQYKNPENRDGAYWQISYTRQMKSQNGIRPPGMGRGGAQTDREVQAVQTPDRPMGQPGHRAITTGHENCENDGQEVGWNSVLSSNQEYVEDCPVCCRANVIQVKIGHDEASVCAEAE